jgi:pyruvate kinase
MKKRANGKKAKIVATLGPASESPEVIEGLIAAGVNVIRLNLSHGKLKAHERAISTVREVSEMLGANTAILLDLQGPRIRTGRLPGGKVTIEDGGEVMILREGGEGAAGGAEGTGTGLFITTTYADFHKDVKPGDRILIDDGLIELKVVEVAGEVVRCGVVHGGVVGEHKGMNLPGVEISAPSFTDKDILGIELGIRMEADYIALSFVRTVEDVLGLKAFIAEKGADIPVIAKIEKAEAIDALPAILKESDGVMIARGDLGVELSPERVPVLQKRIIHEANETEKVVITATQMLDSMISNPRPTRAEASDVANAVFDGTDALMLSGETAVGKYPVKAVEFMRRIIVEAESATEERPHLLRRVDGSPASFAHMIGFAAYAASGEEQSKAIVVFTQTGDTALILSKLRPATPIVAFTPLKRTCRRLALVWGIEPFAIEFGVHTDEMICRGEAALLDRGLADFGDTVVIVSGTKVGLRGATNMMKIDWIGSDECRLYLKGGEE